MLAWLLGQDRGGDVQEALAGAETVVASDLTVVECQRVLIRAWSTGLLPEAERIDREARLARTAAGWTRLRVGEEVVERARRPFPLEPVRTVDALHLASALVARTAAPDVVLVSLDHRVRQNGERLGLRVGP